MEMCSGLNLLSDFEKQRLVQIIDEYIVDNPYLAKNKHLEYLYSGVAAHHAGLLPAWKSLVEKLFQQGLIKVHSPETRSKSGGRSVQGYQRTMAVEP